MSNEFGDVIEQLWVAAENQIPDWKKEFAENYAQEFQNSLWNLKNSFLASLFWFGKKWLNKKIENILLSWWLFDGFKDRFSVSMLKMFYDEDKIDKLLETREKLEEAQNKEEISWLLDNLKQDVMNDVADYGLTEEETKNIKETYNSISWAKPSWESFLPAYIWYQNIDNQDKIQNKKFLTIVDYTKSNQEKRFYVIDLEWKTSTSMDAWHAKESWEEFATEFSNVSWSNKSSMWFFTTSMNLESNSDNTWEWLRLTWLDQWYNDNSSSRWLFIHQWWVDDSKWCITIPKSQAEEVLEDIKWKSLVFVYTKSKEYLASNDYLNWLPDSGDQTSMA